MANKRGVGSLLLAVAGCASTAPSHAPTPPRAAAPDPALAQLHRLAVEPAALTAGPQARRAWLGGQAADQCDDVVVAVLDERADAVRVATIEPTLVVAAWVPRAELATVVITPTPLYAAIDDAAASVTLRPGAPVDVAAAGGPRGRVTVTTLGESAAGFVDRAALGQVYTPLPAPALDGPRVQAPDVWVQAAPAAGSPQVFTTFAGVYVERGRVDGYVEVEHAGPFVAGRGFVAEAALRPTPAIGACEGNGGTLGQAFGATHAPDRWAGSVRLPAGACLHDAASDEIAAIVRAGLDLEVSVLTGATRGEGTIATTDGPRDVVVPVVRDAAGGYVAAVDTCGRGAS